MKTQQEALLRQTVVDFVAIVTGVQIEVRFSCFAYIDKQ